MQQIHGHDVMDMMLASGQTYTRETLVAAIRERFGAEARFYTCSAADMTAEEMVAFLEVRGKLVPRADGFQTSRDLMCQHG